MKCNLEISQHQEHFIFSDSRESDLRTKTINFEIRKSTKKTEFQTQTLKHEMKSVVLENYELEYRKKVKTKSSYLACTN